MRKVEFETGFHYFTFFKKDLFILCVCFACMHVCRVRYIPGALRGQKRSLDPLELELQTVVNCQRVLGIKPRSSRRAVSALNLWSIPPVSTHTFCF